MKIHPRVYVKKYMRKGVYTYVRYYLEIPRKIALPSLGFQLQAHRLADYIIIGPAGHSDFLSIIRKLARHNSLASADRFHVRVGSSSNRTEPDEKP